MTESATVQLLEPDLRSAQASALMYGLLARVLDDPDASGWAHLVDVQGPALESLAPADEGLATAVATLAEALRGTTFEAARSAARVLFPPVESPDCPSYESAYRGGDAWVQADLMADVAGFYRAHGLRLGSQRRQRPDHIGVELEFMGVVAAQEVDALERGALEQVEACRLSADAFLADHLGCWGVAYGARVARLAPADYLRAAGRTLSAWLQTEFEVRSVRPVMQVDGPDPRVFSDDIGPDDVDEGDACDVGGSSASIIPASSLTKRPRKGALSP